MHLPLSSLFTRKKSSTSSEKSSRSSTRRSSTQDSPISSPEKKERRKRRESRQKKAEEEGESPRPGALRRSRTAPITPQDEHPLNLPPKELARLSSAWSKMSERNDHSDIDSGSDVEKQESTQQQNGTSKSTNGSPTQEKQENGSQEKQENGVNGSHDTDTNVEDAPVPPPHKESSTPPSPVTPPVDPEACKEEGNKYFKAQQWQSAITEYTKGKQKFILIK